MAQKMLPSASFSKNLYLCGLKMILSALMKSRAAVLAELGDTNSGRYTL